MLVHLIYDNPTWLIGLILATLWMGGAAIGLLIFHRFVHLEIRKQHNDLAGFMIETVSVTYAVLLAFIAVATWETYSKAESVVDSEADYVSSLYRDTQALPAAMGASIRSDLRDYVATVVNSEWRVQQEGQTPTEGWIPLHKLHSAIVTMQPSTMGEAVIQAELLRVLNQLYSARSSRLAAVGGHVPTIIWWIILLGGILTTAFTYLFGFDDFRMHVVMTMCVSASLALVVLLIVALDWPFRGEISVSPDAFIKAQQSWSDLPFSK